MNKEHLYKQLKRAVEAADRELADAVCQAIKIADQVKAEKPENNRLKTQKDEISKREKRQPFRAATRCKE